MRSSTSSSELRFVVAFATTLLVLLASWEAVLRARSGATIDFAIERPPVATKVDGGKEWVVFGNCLMMTGVSPRQLNEEVGGDDQRLIVNISTHEQSPIAYFDYLARGGRYPDVIIANVSSWINGTNFDQEAALVAKADPLGIAAGAKTEAPAEGAATHGHAFKHEADVGHGELQRWAESALSREAGDHVHAIGHRYHLFDYSLFLGTLATSGNLDNALYQLNMQSWFRVTGSETDGLGFLGLDVGYRADWSTGLERMADRSLQRLRLSRLLTPEYWGRLERDIVAFQKHGTKVLLVRMPEHPKIRSFNDETYDLPGRLRGIEERTGAPVLDLSRLGPNDGVHLFDAVHPDVAAARVITHAIAAWLRSGRVTIGVSGAPARIGGG